MYARIGKFHIQPGKRDEEIQLYRDAFLPVARQQQGFRGGLLLTDHRSNKAISITLWETEADLLAGETSGYLREQLAKAASVMTAAPVVEAYEVSIQA